MSDDGRAWAAAADVMRALGGPDFGAALLRAAAGLTPVDHLSLFRFGADLAPQLVLAESSGGGTVAAEAGRRYQEGGYHRFDPNLGHLQQAVGDEDTHARPDGTLVLRLTAAEIPDGAYRASIYDRFDLGERLSLIDVVAGRWLALNLYRERRHGPSAAADLRRLQAGAGFLTAAAGRHAQQVAPQADRPRDAAAQLESLLRAEPLSPREAQVCARALIGMTNLGIALELGVKESTIATLRRRAYAKLGIASVHELFLLCLRRLGGRAAGTDQASMS